MATVTLHIEEESFNPRRTACRGCGKEMVWGLDEDGKAIPLDPRAPVYRIARIDASGQAIIRRDKDAMVGHHVTCPERKQFRKRKED